MSPSGSSQVHINVSGAKPPAEGSSAERAKSQPDDRTVISDRPLGAGVGEAQRAGPFELGKLLEGDRLGHFELLEYVGGGGMGAVFRARDTMLDREVALKVLSRSQGADDETRRRFHVEAQSAARLDHQNIARVYYVGEDQGLNFIVFEFIKGVNLRDLVERQGVLALGDAISYTLQVAEALAHANERNVVHRDIKPSNIIVTQEGRAKLVDMGLARLHARTSNDDLTASGVTLGTFDYISPEQARDPRVADVRSDIYSLGCTLYYMVTGRPPFPEGTVLQKLLQHQGDEVPDPRQINPEVPEEIAAILQRMLAKDPRRRFQDPGELIAELLIVADRLDLRPITSSQIWIAPYDQGRPFWERHLPWMAPVALLLFTVLGLEWFGSSSFTAPPEEVHPRVLASAPATKNEATASVLGESASAKPAVAESSGGVSNAEPGTRTSDGSGTVPNSRNVAASPRATERGSTAGTAPEPSKSTPAPSTLSSNAESARPAAVPGALPAGTAAESVGDRGVDATVAQSPLSLSGDTDLDRIVSTRQDALDAAGGAADAAEHSPAQTPPATTTGFTIVPSDGGERKPFASLKAACLAAKNNDVIELQFNGLREQAPLELTNLKLTIRAGTGYRPTIVFRPGQSGLAGFGRQMISVAGGRLTLLNVGLLLDIPRDATAEGWSLFEARQAEQLRFEGCALTIRNQGAGGDGFHDNVSFFEIKAAPGLDSMMKTPETPPVHPVNLDLQNCVVRGEAAFIHSADAQPLAVDWDNGLLAISEPLFLAEGTSASVPSGERADIRLNHLTAITRSGLIRIVAASDAPYVLKTDVSCANSFLVTRDAPLVEQRGPHRIPMLEQQFQWSGDRNFCQGFSVFWQLVDVNALTPPRLVLAAQWQSQMGQGDNLLPASEKLWKRTGNDDRPLHTLRREDFLLADRLRVPGGTYEASDNGEIGMDPRKLPDLPSDALPILRSRDGSPVLEN